jgi:hypothetical protein
MPKSCLSVLPLLVTIGAVACSSPSSTSGDAPDGAGPSVSADAAGCKDYTGPLETYSAGMTRPGDSGALKFQLVSATPPPPATQNMTWTLKITDSTGQPVTGATFSPAIKTWMPQHTHGSTAVPMAVEKGDGVYEIDNLYLYMIGVWQVTFYVKSGTTTDKTTFAFCLDGA